MTTRERIEQKMTYVRVGYINRSCKCARLALKGRVRREGEI